MWEWNGACVITLISGFYAFMGLLAWLEPKMKLPILSISASQNLRAMLAIGAVCCRAACKEKIRPLLQIRSRSPDADLSVLWALLLWKYSTGLNNTLLHAFRFSP